MNKFFFILTLSIPAVLIPSVTQACAVCFGGASGDLKRGFFWGVLILLTLPFALAGVFIGVIARATKKNKNP